MARLVDKSLVVLDDKQDGQAPYRLLEPVREYANSQLAARAQSAATRSRHCACYVAVAEQAEPEMHRVHQAAWMRCLEREFDNVREAVRTGRARADAESVLRLAGALWWYLWVRGHLREGLDWVEGLLDPPEVPVQARMAGLRASAMLLGSLGRSSEASGRARELMVVAEREGDVVEMARVATLLGLEEVRASHIDQARPLLERALAQARAVDHPMLLRHALVNLGAIWFQLGHLAQVEDLYREALVYFERVGDGWGIAYATNYLAALVRQRGDPQQAAHLSAEAVRWLINLGDRFYLIFAVEDLAGARMDRQLDQSGARLLGGAHGLRLARGALLSPFSLAENERDVMRLRSALGDLRFAQAWAEGVGQHIEHILRKLDVRSRHQVADWAQAHGLASD